MRAVRDFEGSNFVTRRYRADEVEVEDFGGSTYALSCLPGQRPAVHAAVNAALDAAAHRAAPGGSGAPRSSGPSELSESDWGELLAEAQCQSFYQHQVLRHE